MKLKDLPDAALDKALAATEHTLGPDSYEARVLRREVERRAQAARRHAAQEAPRAGTGEVGSDEREPV